MSTGDEKTPRLDDESRLAQLDGLRAFAVIAVVASHYGPGHESLTNALRPFSPVSLTHSNLGHAGVWLFFALSGFLITGILIRCRDAVGEDRPGQKHAWRVFYARRALRILPLSYLVVALAAALNLKELRDDLPWYLLNGVNFLVVHRGHWLGPLGVMWTLSIEEQFYLLWPIVVLFGPRRLWLPTVWLLVCCGPASRLVTYAMTGSYASSITMTTSAFDGFGAGALIVVVRQVGEARSRRLSRGLLIASGLLCLGKVAITNGLPEIEAAAGVVIDPLIYSTSFAWLVGAAARGFGGILGWVLSWGPLVHIGKVSYAVYLFHNLIPGFLEMISRKLHTPVTHLADRSLVHLTIVLVCSVAFASISWVCFESPINSLKRHVRYPKGRGTAPARRLDLLEEASREAGSTVPGFSGTAPGA